jgi:ABC-type Fe3+-hydroxamate transport system substrate-binding protein
VFVLRIRSIDDVGEQLPALAARIEVAWSMPTLASPGPPSATAFVPIWKRPWMALGTPTYGASLLEHLGISNVFAGAGSYPETTLEAVAERSPTLVIAPSEPYPFGERQRSELEAVAPTIFVDGKDLFWWGTHTAGAVTRLASAICDHTG